MFSPGSGKGGSKGQGKNEGSPTEMEMGNIPIPPSTPSTGRQQGQQTQGFVAGSQGAGGLSGVGMGNGFQGSVGNGFGQGSGFVGPSAVPQVPMMPQMTGVDPRSRFQNPGNSQAFGPQTGFAVGGLTPQMQSVQQVMGLAQGLSNQQVMTLIQGLQEQVQSQGRMNPVAFGQVPFGLPADSSLHDPTFGLGLQGGASSEGSRDVFSKSEKWIGSPPIPNFKNWVSRESEVIGWAQFIADLSGWAAQASIQFSMEIQQSCRWHEEISWDSMTSARRARAMRLQAILKSVFQEHLRSINLINAFTEGVSLVSAGAMVNASQSGNGFELFRQLTCEYSLRTRSEALALRAAFSMKSFHLSAQETSPSSVVTDTIRKLDLEAARFSKLISALPSSVDTIGIQLTDSDLLLVLMRSLPEVVKAYAVHHSRGDSYQAYRESARRWEQQRLFGEHMTNQSNSHNKNKLVNELSYGEWQSEVQSDSPGTQWYSLEEGWQGESWPVDSVASSSKCQRCGSRKHGTDSCQVDLSKTKCFRCNEFGHVGLNCPQNGKHGKGKGKPGDAHAKGKGSSVSLNEKGKNGKGKGSKSGKGNKGFGKKGKLNQLEMTADDWWWQDDGWEGSYDDWSWHVSQVDWYDAGWYDDSWKESGKIETESKPEDSEKKSDNPVGSLSLHALTDHGCCSCDCHEHVCNDEHVGRLMLHEEFDVAADVDVPVLHDMDSLSHVGREVSWIQPLKGPDDGLEPRCDLDGLLCEEPRRVCLQRTRLDVGFDVSDTVCNCRVVSQAFSSLCPILAELSFAQDPTWWLIDSGAAVTVVAESNFHHFQTSVQSSAESDRFRAANGSKVSMKGVAEISLGFALMDPQTGKKRWKKATLNAMVGNTQHNILSTTALCKSGWTFSQWSGGAELKHDATGHVISGIVQHSGCPWVKLQPEAWDSVKSVRFDEGSLGQDSGCVNVAPLSPAVEAQLETHRKQGHFPHHPQCTECSKARSVFKHRRRGLQNVEVEVQADFCFLSSTGEIVEGDLRNKNIKILVLTEMLSGCVGYVLACENRQRVNGDIERWLDSFGLMSNLTSVVLHTDDEKAVGDLVGKSTRHYLFQVRRAAPQQHRSIGGAERAVRKLKESLAVVRGDLNKQGLDIRYSYEGVRDVITFLALMNNHFGRSGGTDLSPLETSAGRPLSKPVTSMFGSTVIAEIPDSIRQYSPNESRSIEAAYVHPGIGSGAAVEGWLRVDGRLELRRFYARNVLEVVPIAWNLDLCRSFLSPLDPRDDGGRQDRRLVADQGQGVAAGQDRSVVDERRGVLTNGSEPSLSNKVERGGEVSGGEGLPVDVGSPVVGNGEEVLASGSGDELKRASVSIESEETPLPKRSRTYRYTPGCPSCETGMNAPGIRHSALCKRRQNPEFAIPVEESVGPPVFQPQPVVLPDGEAQRSEALSRKRSSDVSVERLEEEIKQEGEVEPVDISSLVDGLCWHDH